MSLFHVPIEGLDRRNLTALGTRHRVVVVGHREDARTGKVSIEPILRRDRRRGSASVDLPSPDSKRSTLPHVSVRQKVVAASSNGSPEGPTAT